MLAAAGTPSFLSILGVVVALLIGLSGITAIAWIFFRGNAGKNLIAQQDAAINALTTTVAEQDRQLGIQAEQLARFQREHQQMQAQIGDLRELVTQAAKVDNLIALVHQGFAKLGAKLDEPGDMKSDQK